MIVGNYNQANQVFMNDGSGGFSENSSSAIAVGSDSTYSESVALGDLDGDGGAISSRPRVALAAARATRGHEEIAPPSPSRSPSTTEYVSSVLLAMALLESILIAMLTSACDGIPAGGAIMFGFLTQPTRPGAVQFAAVKAASATATLRRSTGTATQPASCGLVQSGGPKAETLPGDLTALGG